MSDSPKDPPDISGIPFSFFTSLIRGIAGIKQCSSKDRAAAKFKEPRNGGLKYTALGVFQRWVGALRAKYSPLPAGTTAICFRLLFPEDDIERKYDIQEPRMTKLLAECLCMREERFEEWDGEEASGCLGEEVRQVLEKSCSHDEDYSSPISIEQVSKLLDELAALSPWSHRNVRARHPKGRRRTRNMIMRDLFRSLSPYDAGVLVQIILKDLQPLLYPLTEFHYTAALTHFNTAAVRMLEKEHAMFVWDTSQLLSKFYRVRSTLDEAAAFADNPENTSSDIQPRLGVPISIPKSRKGQNCAEALKALLGSRTVWAETKYDGERAQIHVKITEDGASHITIFSKSKRDSTKDRLGVHNVIRAALGLPLAAASGMQLPQLRCSARVKQNVILDAEMVAFRGATVDEFWHIASLIADTGHGPRARRLSHVTAAQEHESLDSRDNGDLALGLVFFDVLYLENKSLLGATYTKRREILESLIHVEPGQCILAARYEIRMSTSDTTQAEETLRWIFAHHIAAHEEGVVLKAAESKYNNFHWQWVKLKKDYIPHHGDCVDMVILGATWEKVRGRSLRVSPSAYTTFHIGALENKKDMNKPNFKPRFHAYFTVAYGLSRDQLEQLNFWIKNSDTLPYDRWMKKPNDLNFDITFRGDWQPLPTVILQTPLVVELFGAGFTKAQGSQHYELRFPRMTKVHRPCERSWLDAVSLDKLHDIACESVGRERAGKAEGDIVKAFFGQPVSPGIKSEAQHNRRMITYHNKLAASEEAPLYCARTPPRVEPHGAGASPRRGVPLAAKTNVFQAGARAAVFDKVDSPMQLSIPCAPLQTPPASSPVAQTPPRAGPVRLLVQTPQQQPRLEMSTTLKRAASPPTPEQTPKKAKVAHVPAEAESKHEMQVALAAPTAHVSVDAETKPEAHIACCAPAAHAPAEAQIKEEVQCTPPDIELDSTLVFFAKPGGKACASWRASRRTVPKYIHSMKAMLAGCGWTAHALDVADDVVKGVIIVDECDGQVEEWRESIRYLLADEAERAPTKKRVEVLVYGCRSAAVLERFI